MKRPAQAGRRTLYIAGYACWPALIPTRKTDNKPCNHPQLRTDGTCAACKGLIYDRTRRHRTSGTAA